MIIRWSKGRPLSWNGKYLFILRLSTVESASEDALLCPCTIAAHCSSHVHLLSFFIEASFTSVSQNEVHRPLISKSLVWGGVMSIKTQIPEPSHKPRFGITGVPLGVSPASIPILCLKSLRITKSKIFTSLYTLSLISVSLFFLLKRILSRNEINFQKL